MSAIIKVSIIGPESSGKTYLAAKLANYYKCYWAPEYAREYLSNLKTPYTKNDIEQIARGQLDYEDVLITESEKLLICDTDLIVIKIWIEHKFGKCPTWIDDLIDARRYNLYLLMYPDIPYEEDPLREHPELGQHFFNQYKTLLTRFDFPYAIINGDYNTRLKKSIAAIDKVL